MKAWTWMAAMGICLASWQAMAQELDELKTKSQAQPRPGLPMTDAVISKAVREMLAEQPGSPRLHSEKALSGDAYQKFERAFSEAEKPGCMNSDAMKFQPHSLSFKMLGQEYVMGVSGKLAIPFWIAAIVRGKCK